MARGVQAELDISIAPALSDVDRSAWDALANPALARFDPFLSWDFLEALESSHCAAPEEGWTPLHLLARDGAGALMGAMPLYAKGHSQGEYVFDHSWADAFHRAGGRYYPKLLSAVPFTPATGRRILTQNETVERALADAAIALAQRAGASSVHVTFAEAAQAERLAAGAMMRRTGMQYHWTNAGYGDFGDFLSALSSQKRKNIRKERERARAGLNIRRLTGADIQERDIDFFYRCYLDTGSRKWGSPYLNREFFLTVAARMPERILLFIAEESGAPIASAINFIGGETLFGRYWGCLTHRDFLHFELCYHQAIDFAIERGLARVEAGAQGAHKLARGYAPAPTASLHWIAHQGLSQAIARFLESETPAMVEEIEAIAEHAPFKRLGHDGAPTQ